MALDVSIFASDFAVALADMPAVAVFESISLNVLFQKINQSESLSIDGIEQQATATMMISKAELDAHGIAAIEIGDKLTSNGIEYRVLDIQPYPHRQYSKYSLTDLLG